MIDDAESEEDLMLLVHVVRAFLRGDYTVSEDLSSIVTTLLGTCYVLNSVRGAIQLTLRIKGGVLGLGSYKSRHVSKINQIWDRFGDLVKCLLHCTPGWPTSCGTTRSCPTF